MEVEDSDLQYDFKGSLLSDKKQPIPDVEVRLIDVNGNILKSVRTNNDGAFQFENLNSLGNSLFELDEKDKKLAIFKKIYLTNYKGEIIKEFTLVNGKFRFSILKPEENKNLSALQVEDTDLRYDFKGNLLSDAKTPIADVEVRLVDENRKILKSVRTNTDGSFQFDNLNAFGNTLFELDEKDKKLAFFKKIYVTNFKGEIIKEFTLTNGKFRFKIGRASCRERV